MEVIIVNKLKQIIVNEVDDYKILLRNAPAVTMIFFSLSVVFMNIFAGKELLNISYLALDCGFLVSWISFLCMDMLTKRFGAKPAIKLSFFTVFVNILCVGLFFVMSKLGNHWSEYYNTGSDLSDAAINNLFGGTWYVIVGSMTAFAIASVVNAIINFAIGKAIKKKNFLEYALRSYVSTALGQFVDNFVFASLVSVAFFGWTWKQVVFCSFVGAATELLAEVVFSPIGFKVCKKWESEGIGNSYIEYLNNKKAG